MRREVSLEEISDGRLYGLNDMVKADCGDCKGCSACCQGMGESIVLDPLDIYHLETGLHKTFEELLLNALELHIVDGVILPNLKMSGPNEICTFLSEEGRCQIHPFRPGICRIFPLGRFYENNAFQYFLQTGECKKDNRTKVKVSKWIDTKDIKKNQQYIADWHYFLKDVEKSLERETNDDTIKSKNMYLLNTFYVKPYDVAQDFYVQFYERLKEAQFLKG